MTAVISPARTEQDLADVRALMVEYAETFDVIDRCFEGVDRELAELPGVYAPPRGALLLARSPGSEPLGCIALKPVADGMCEMKRLYVRPDAQGQGLGRRLAEALIEHARVSGATAVRLDTLAEMHAAQALYRDLGFKRIAPYNTNPTPGIIYLELKL